jgi:alkyl hydroperoxide reductase subunit D
MRALETLRASLPDGARDIQLNLQSVLQGGTLTLAQRWGVAIASALASRSPELAGALTEAALAEVDPGVVDDAQAAAALMGMNNVYYRFRHALGKPAYDAKSPRLRMNRLAKPASSRVDLELFALAVSAINDCQACLRAHEHAVIEGGLTEDQVHDAVRIASVVHATAVALNLLPGGVPSGEAP